MANRATALAVCAVLGLAAACGGSVDRKADVLSVSAERAADEDSGRGRSVVEWVDDGKPLRTVCDEAFDLRRERTKSFCTGVTIGAVDGLREDVIRIEGTTYVRLATEKWTRLPTLPDTESRAGPGLLLERLQDGAAEIERVGTDTVRGVDATEYEVQLEAPAEELGGAKSVRLWVDADDLLRRVRYQQAPHEGRPPVVTLEYFDYGAEVEIEEPDPSEIDETDDDPSG